MILRTVLPYTKCTICLDCRAVIAPKRFYSQELEKKYSEAQKEKILQVVNESDADALSRYDITKARIKYVAQWKTSNGPLKTLEDIDMIEGFSDKYAKKLFDSILFDGPKEKDNAKKNKNKIKGQILHPLLSETIRKESENILSVYITVNSVCWTLITKSKYEVVEWDYFGINYPEGKRLQITDIMNIAWQVIQKLPHADIYVMKAEATTLRAAGSDPNNPKVMAVNLQKAQLVSMIVALINARQNQFSHEKTDQKEEFTQKVYFLRPSLPFRLYGTLIGTEKVSTDQTVEMLLQTLDGSTDSQATVPDTLKNMFRNQKELQRDMLGHSLLLALTFMDLCIYNKQESVDKLLRRGE